MDPLVIVPKDLIASFCQERGIDRLAIFGSALGSQFGADSDLDVLVEFGPGRVPGLLGMARIERELSGLFGNRKIDLRTLEDLSIYFRDKVLEEAEVQYERG